LSAYIDGELRGRQATALESHLGGCEGCREELETLQSAIALLAAPKAMARPEGLLAEFKAEYLPRLEATAPAWSFRVPALPKLAWPSMSRLMLPMGGMAAAAAALLVALHQQSTPTTGATAPAASTRVAQVPVASHPADLNAGVSGRAEPVAAPKKMEAAAVRSKVNVPASTAGRRPAGEPETASPAVRAHRSAPVLAALPAPTHPVIVRYSPGPRLIPGKQYADAHSGKSALTEDQIRAAGRHARGERTAQERWADEAVVTIRKASEETVEDGYAEISVRNVKTGDVKSMTVAMPALPATAPAASESQKAASDEVRPSEPAPSETTPTGAAPAETGTDK
jgi:hypothetical protein